MKPTPMMALPVATLMMLLSSTFVRLPGTGTIEIVYPRTNLPQASPVSIPEPADLDYHQETGYTGTLRSGDIQSTMVALDLFDAWNACQAKDKLTRTSDRMDSVRGYSPMVTSTSVISGNDHAIALKKNFIRERRVSRR